MNDVQKLFIKQFTTYAVLNQTFSNHSFGQYKRAKWMANRYLSTYGHLIKQPHQAIDLGKQLGFHYQLETELGLHHTMREVRAPNN